jgi:natural product precursor
MKENQKKLSLNKSRVANLSKDELKNVLGGAAEAVAASTNHNFTCKLCTTAPGSVSIHTSAVTINPTTTA